MLPTIEGVIARRVLINYWADPTVVRKLVPEPLEIATHNDLAVVGICLIRMENLRPKGLPLFLGMSSENIAHRIAIRFATTNGMRDGVYILRRDTDQPMVSLLGGRLFPGVHGSATFGILETESSVKMDVRSKDGSNVLLSAQVMASLEQSRLFDSFEAVQSFFQKGDCGFSCSLRGSKLEGMQIKTFEWNMTPLKVSYVHSTFYDDISIFPKGSIGLDCAAIMRGIPHEWHELSNVPELASCGK